MMSLLTPETEINPTPSSQPPTDELDLILQSHLSPQKLESITGTKDLQNVTEVELKVDTRKASLSELGRLLPGLRELKLGNSFIPTIRDLGSSYTHLTHLYLPRVSLTDLSGISSLTALKELYLAHNDIEDISDLSFLESLEILDLECNALESLDQIDYLGLCTSLHTLTIAGNPFLDGEEEWIKGGRERREVEVTKKVCGVVRGLRVLDDLDVRNGILDQSPLPLPPTTRPTSSRPRPRSASRPSTATIAGVEDSSSELTHGTGQIMAGSPALFLRSRRSLIPSPSPPVSPQSLSAPPTPHPPPTPPSRPSTADPSTSIQQIVRVYRGRRIRSISNSSAPPQQESGSERELFERGTRSLEGVM